jgi:hypothetical protein
MKSGRGLQITKLVGSNEHPRRKSASAGALAIAAMTNDLNYRFFGAFVPNAFTGAPAG